MSFPVIDCERRTDRDFRDRSDVRHHKEDSDIEELDIDMIYSFSSSDTLHLLDLGVMRRCMFRWVFGERGYEKKWNKKTIDAVSKSLENVQQFMPMEFHRAVRNLSCLRKWKGVKYRTILMYVGMVVFKPILNEAEYDHFLLLCTATRICCSKNSKNFLTIAEKMFTSYIQNYISLYGRHTIGSNVHLLSHIVEDMQRNNVESIMELSTYKFENSLRLLGLNIKHGYLPLQQVAKRILENSQLRCDSDSKFFELQHLSPQLRYMKQNGTFEFDQIRLSSGVTLSNRKAANSWFLTKNKEIVQMKYAKREGDEFTVAGACIDNKRNFFLNPIASSKLDIFASDGKVSEKLNIYSTESIFGKMSCLPCEELINGKLTKYFVFIPLSDV